jgi:hypothetical protein
LTEDCRAWVLELNANPSLRVDFESETAPGVFTSVPSPLDFFVKSQVVEDAILIARMKKAEQVRLESYNSYEKLLPNEYPYEEAVEFISDLERIFSNHTEIKNPQALSSGRFRKICGKIRGRLPKEIIPADYDIIYLWATKRLEVSQMDLFAFIAAIERIAKNYCDGSIESNVRYIISLLV